MCRNKTWHTVCKNAFSSSDNNTKVACRQLGYTGSKSTEINISCTLKFDLSQQIVFQCTVYSSLYSSSFDYSQPNGQDRTQYDCSGEEESLNECRMVEQYNDSCSSEPTRLSCRTLRLPECDSDGCENDTAHVRLVGGPSEREGRVAICYNGLWSSLCDISSNVATTICRQLGYTNGFGRVKNCNQNTFLFHVIYTTCIFFQLFDQQETTCTVNIFHLSSQFGVLHQQLTCQIAQLIRGQSVQNLFQHLDVLLLSVVTVSCKYPINVLIIAPIHMHVVYQSQHSYQYL